MTMTVAMANSKTRTRVEYRDVSRAALHRFDDFHLCGVFYFCGVIYLCGVFYFCGKDFAFVE